MIWPYRRGSVARDTARLDGWLPRCAWMLERHAIDVPLPPADALAVIIGLRLRDVPVVRALFKLRGLSTPAGGATTLLQFFSTRPFLLLEEELGREIVCGVVGPFWQRRRGGLPRFIPDTPGGFREALAEGRMAALANFRADPLPGGARLWTETWVHAPSPGQRAAFTAYWLTIGPFSAWIRRMFLRSALARAVTGGRISKLDAWAGTTTTRSER